MACRYWYDGEFRSEEEFKSILENGLIDKLIRDGNVEFKQDFPLDESLIKNSTVETRNPLELSILRKVQRGKNLNTQTKEETSMNENGETVYNSIPVRRNPVAVLEESRKKKPGKYNKKLTLLVATNEGLWVNGNLVDGPGIGKEDDAEDGPTKGSAGYKILQDLKNSMSADQFSALYNLDPEVVGSVFMIVDSTSGAFPVKLFTNKIQDTKEWEDVQKGLKLLSDPKADLKEKQDFEKTINRITYMYDVKFEDGKYIVERIVKNKANNSTKKVSIPFEKNSEGKYVAQITDATGEATTKTIEEYVGNSIYRVDYTRINRGDYNKNIADKNVIKTDLYQEDGNFFHSSNLILSYSVVNPRTDLVIKKQLSSSLGPSGPGNANSTENSSKNDTPNPKADSNNKPDEANGIFDMSADKAINADPTNVVRYITLKEQRDKEGNVIRKKKTYRVYAEIKGIIGPDTKLEITNRELVKINPNGTYQVIGKYDLTEGQTKIVDELFFKDKLVKQKNAVIKKNYLETEMYPTDIDPSNVTDLDQLVDSKQKVESPNESSDLFDDMDDIEAETGNQLGENDVREKRVVKEELEEQKTWDKKKELEHLKKILGKAFVRKSGKDGTVRVFKNFETLKEYLPAKTYQMLLEANKNGSELFGLFSTAAILIKHNAPAGVAFHEAFHVVFNLALPIQDRIKILNEAYLKYPELKTKVLESGRELTWLELEEFLADEFMDYAMRNEEFTGSQFDPRDNQQKTKDVLAGKENFKEIPKFFKGLNRMLNVFFKQNSAIDIDTLFEEINTGYYSDKIEFKNTALDTSVRQMSRVSERVTSPQRKFNSALELEASLQTLTSLMFQNLEVYRKENGLEDTSISDAQIINKIGVSNLMASILTRVVSLRKGAKGINNKELTEAYSSLLSVLTNDNKALARTKEGKPLVVNKKLQFKESTPLLESFLADVKARYNLNMTFNGESFINDKIDLNENPAVNAENELDAFLKEETTGDAVAMTNSIEVNPKENVSQILKRFLNRIPKRNEKGGRVYNMHDQLIYEDGNKVFGHLIGQISNSYSYEDMIAKLEKVNRPWAKDILEEISKYDKSDTRNIGRSLWLSIGNKNFLYYSTIIKENGVFKRMGTNRNTLDNIIKDKILAEFLNTDNILFKTEAGKNWKENIVEEAAEDFFKDVSSARSLLVDLIAKTKQTDEEVKKSVFTLFEKIQKDPKSLFQEGQTEVNKKRAEDLQLLNFKNLSETLSKYNIELSPSQIESIYNPNLKDPVNSLNKLNNLLLQIEKLAGALSGGRLTRVRNRATRAFDYVYQFDNIPRNPFLSKEKEELTEEEIEKGAQEVSNKADNDLLNSLAAAMEPGLANEGLFAFRNMDGKTIYALIYSGQINKMLEQIKDPEELQKVLDKTGTLDNFVKQLPLVQELLDPDSEMNEAGRNYMGLTILDGMREERKSQGVVYSRMSDQELFGTQIGMYINNQSKIKSEGFKLGRPSYFKLGIASDSPNIHFINAPSLEKKVIVDKLVQTARAEHSRILKVQNLEKNFAESKEDAVQDELLKIPNYIKNGKKWQTLSFLNNSEVGIATMKNGFNEAGIREAIEEFLTEDVTKEGGFFNKQFTELKEKGIIKSIADNGDVLFNSGVIDTRITSSSKINNTEFLKGYLLNQFYYNTQLNTLFGGDIAFYKGTVDAQKRFKQLFSPGTYTLSEGNMDAVILDDIEELTEGKTLEVINSIIEDSNLTDAEKRLTKEVWKQKHNITDAASILSLRRRKEILEDLDRWTPDMEESYKRIERGEDTLEDFHTVNSNPFASPAKPFFYTVRNINGARVPLQIKDAEFVPTPAFALQKEGDAYKYPKLAALYLDLNGGKNLKGQEVQPKFDMAIFESAVKVGAVANNVTIDDKGDYKYTFNSYQEVDGEFKINEGFNVIQIDKADYRLQQETPPHFIDDRSNFSTQTRNIIIQDLDSNPDNKYDLGNGDLRSGEETAMLFQEIVSNDLERDYNKIRDEFLLPNGDLNYETLLPILATAAKDRGYGPSYLEAIKPVKNSKGEIRSFLPLYHPKINYQTQALVNSIIRNRVTKQKINGGQVANFTSYGVSDKLNMTIENGGITLEAIMPWTSAKYFPTDENGNVDIKKLQETKEGRELLEIVANRIPTEDKYSIFNIKIVGFSPQSMGGQIILPREITTIAGLDFDIDKLFFMMKNFYYKNGEIKIDRFVDKVETEEEQENLARNIYSSLASYTRYLDTIGIRGSQKELKIQKYKEEFKESAQRQKDSEKFSQQIEAVDNFLKALTEQEEDFEFTVDEQFYSEEQIKELNNIKSFLATQPSQNIIRLNSKKASDNKKIDIMKGILKNKYTTPMILQTGNFETLHAYASRIRLLRAGKTEEAKLKGKALIEAANKLDEDNDFNINYPSTQLELFRRNMDGRDLTGIFANHTSHHAKAQHTNLKLKDPITINKKKYINLNKSIVNGTRVSRTLAVKDAAVVDNAKEPLAGFLNINYFTADTVALSDRLGVPEGFTYALINQPIILRLTREFFNDPGTFNPGGMIYDLKGDLVEKIQKASGRKFEEIYEAVKKRLNTLDTKQLEETLKAPNIQNTDYLMNQLVALTLFENLYNIGSELGTGVQAARVDTQALNPTNAENFTVIQKQKKTVQKERDPEKGNYIEGLSEIFVPGRSSTQIMIPSFNEFGILKPTSDITEKIFPSVGTYNENEARFDYSFLGTMKQELADELKSSGLINEKHARLIDTQFINYIATGYPFFDASQSKDILTKTPDKLRKIRQALQNPNSQLSKAVNDNLEGIDNRKAFLRFVNDLEIKDKEKGIPLEKRIVYYNSGKGKEDFQTMEVIWEQMLHSSNPVIKDFALDLVKYSFFSNGYGYGPYSIADLIPPSFWGDEYQAKLNADGSTFNEYMETIFRDLKNNSLDESKTSVNSERFKKQLVQAFGRSPGLVKTTQVKLLSAAQKAKNKLSKDSDVREFVRLADSGRVGDMSGNVLINTAKNKDFLNEDTKKPLKYVRRYIRGLVDPITQKKGAYQLYELTATEYVNPSTSILTYSPIPMTSISNVVLNLDMNNDITKSWLDKSKPKSSLETTLDNNSTDTRSQKDVKETKTEPESTTVPPVSTKKESKSIKEFKPGQRVQDENYQIFEILSLEEWQKETKIPNMTSGVKARFITNVNPNLKKRADDLNPDSTTYTKPGSLITMPENTLVSLVEKTKKEGGLFEEGPKKETKKDNSGLFEEGPVDPYNYSYREEIKENGMTEKDWNTLSKKEKQNFLDCKGL